MKFTFRLLALACALALSACASTVAKCDPPTGDTANACVIVK